jgi:hypothetical protein
MADHTAATVPRRDDVQEGTGTGEHMAAWAMVLLALALGAIGLLRAFGVIGDNPVAQEVGAAGTQDPGFGAIWDGALWLLASISAALLAMTLHTTDHHRMRDPDRVNDADRGMWKTEHILAYLMALATLVTGALGLLTGFDVFGRGNDQPDGLPWLLASIPLGILSYTLHAVRHHQMAADEDYVVHLVERRLGTGATGTVRPTTEYGSEAQR